MRNMFDVVFSAWPPQMDLVSTMTWTFTIPEADSVGIHWSLGKNADLQSRTSSEPAFQSKWSNHEADGQQVWIREFNSLHMLFYSNTGERTRLKSRDEAERS